MKRQARMNYRTSKDAAQAAQLAYDQISRQWSTVRGTMVHKASERLPDNADDMVNAMLRAKLPHNGALQGVLMACAVWQSAKIPVAGAV